MIEYRTDIQRDAQDEYKRRFRAWRNSGMTNDDDRDAMIQLVYPAALERALAAMTRRAERAEVELKELQLAVAEHVKRTGNALNKFETMMATDAAGQMRKWNTVYDEMVILVANDLTEEEIDAEENADRRMWEDIPDYED